jgi:hypothetical protein
MLTEVLKAYGVDKVKRIGAFNKLVSSWELHIQTAINDQCSVLSALPFPLPLFEACLICEGIRHQSISLCVLTVVQN